MRYATAIAIVLGASVCLADSRGPSEAHVGIVTTEGAPGLFINPTSGTLAKGQVLSQFCVYTFELGGTTLSAWNAIGAYGITDWLEVGGLLVDVRNDGRDFVGGPWVVARVLEERAWPELSVGAIFREGEDSLRRRTVFAVASKGFALGGDVSLRPLAGVRQLWETNDFDDTLFYAGAELGLPAHLYVVGEVTSEPEGVDELPFSVGLQLRHPAGAAFSLGYVRAFGVEDDPGLFVGIGINWGTD